MCFCYENNFVYRLYVSKKKCKNYINLLMMANENESPCIYIKTLTDLCAKKRIKIKNIFAGIVYNFLALEEFW